MKAALVTSIYGGYDRLIDPPEQDRDVEYLAVVDRTHDGVSRWQQIIEPRPHLHPRFAAKLAKCRPDLYTDADVTVWVDGSAQILRPDFVSWCVDLVSTPGASEWLQFQHPERVCLFSEADVSLNFAKYAGQPVVEQADHYRKVGMPERWGLWATGVIVRRQPAASVAVADAWLVEQTRWTYQDQVSESFVMWRAGMRPGILPGFLWRNEWMTFRPHVSAL